ncbi:FRG domain-containing protein [Trueperella pyogenes]|uniref:FRG domain-containing protein n=1 Tax=Trueperella pyogenes TaxID=1661 RepID=UPI003245837E
MLCPTELGHLSALERMMLMQHHGLPTRLLDVTTNPLVALYFAVSAEPEKDGAVFLFGNQPTADRSRESVELLADFSLYGSWQNLCLDDYLVAAGARIPWIEGVSVNRLKHILTASPLAIIPPLFDGRIRSQAGAFLVWNMMVDFEEKSTNPGTFDKEYTYFKRPPKLGSSNVITGDYSVKLLIPAAANAEMMEVLVVADVTRYRLFPGMDGAMRFLSDEYRDGRRGVFAGWQNSGAS